ISPSLVMRLAQRSRKRWRTSSGSARDVATGQRSTAFVLTLLTFWPPAPELRTKRIVSSRAGTRSRRSGIGARAEGRALRRAQHDLHDLGRRSETHRRPPEARAAADEEPRASALVLARDVLDDQPHDVAERPELPAVRV